MKKIILSFVFLLGLTARSHATTINSAVNQNVNSLASTALKASLVSTVSEDFDLPDDSLNGGSIAYTNKPNTFTAAQTFSGGLFGGGTGQSYTGYGLIVNNLGQSTANGGDFVVKNSGGTTEMQYGATSGNWTMNFGSDTTGDMYYRNSSGYLTRLAAGTSTYVLTSNGAGTAPSWQVASGGGGSQTPWTSNINGGGYTLSSARITRRVNSTTSSGTPTINSDTTDLFEITALAANITSMTSSLSGTPNDGDHLEIRIKDNATPRTIAWGTSYENMGVQLPTTTVASKWLNILLEWNASDSKWACMAVNEG